ncbi:hypothetical protein BDBG_01044 [Blastomyces gilchristii SLH14081]|uniref:Aminoglycoside phosphotransferase domain-containing protein n=1 Tax=Blastomyces gilchristii (strain SLH14081) TaxID=559298 RepID=A0A179UB43_BLAGS|nr:uncharacterized protein BDBG_01044 [Blastomyces gilchristii SLH14081]OAT04499.1 hypothetical protein BDBG_01044 [Blastomyces gilchristii SLH14081]
MDTVHNPSQDIPSEGQNHHESNNQTTTHDANEPKLHKTLDNQRTITLSSALDQEEDMRMELQYLTKMADLLTNLSIEKEEIRKLVASHCGLASPDMVQVPDMIDSNNHLTWLYGSFNVCIPVRINAGSHLPAKMAFRVPLLHKIGEEAFPGNAEEKVRSEAATYIWIHENCPDIPIPNLRGFGVPGGLSFFQPSFVPLWQRIRTHIWRFFYSLFRSSDGSYASFCKYIPQKRTTFFEYSYILIDWIESDDSQILAYTWQQPHTDKQTENLYRGISKVMISLARIPQPRIGSWTIDNDGRLSLSNRPLFLQFHQLENWAIPTIPRNITYSTADSFYLDLLSCHDSRLRYQKNSAGSEKDTREQARDLVMMRALLHEFTRQHSRNGPFVMQLTDLYLGNIFVDKDWNLKHVIDLEWTCSLPLQNLLPPYWLTGKGIDQLEGPEYGPFKTCYEKFAEIFEEEEDRAGQLHHNGHHLSRATSLKSALEDGRFWYLAALRSPKGLFNVFRQHLIPFYGLTNEYKCLAETVSSFWTPGMASFVEVKMKELGQYKQEVRDIFDDSAKSGHPRFSPT